MSDNTYMVIVEHYEGEVLLRRTEEWQVQLDCDGTDGEETLALLLSKVVQWFALRTGSGGHATLCYLGKWLDSREHRLFKEIAQAYEEWDAEEEWDDCVSLHVNRSKLCGADAEPLR